MPNAYASSSRTCSSLHDTMPNSYSSQHWPVRQARRPRGPAHQGWRTNKPFRSGRPATRRSRYRARRRRPESPVATGNGTGQVCCAWSSRQPLLPSNTQSTPPGRQGEPVPGTDGTPQTSRAEHAFESTNTRRGDSSWHRNTPNISSGAFRAAGVGSDHRLPAPKAGPPFQCRLD